MFLSYFTHLPSQGRYTGRYTGRYEKMLSSNFAVERILIELVDNGTA